MSETSAPVERRLALLRQLWVEFTSDPHAQVLIWLFDELGVRLAQGFVRVEGSEGGGTTTLFLPLDEPVAALDEALEGACAALERAWAEAEPQLAASGTPVGWVPPPREAAGSALGHLLALCGGLAQAPGAPWEHVALAPFAYDLPSAEAWRALVVALLRAGLPPGVRVLLPVQGGLPEGLEPSAHPGLWATRPALDLAGLLDELLAELPRDTPGARAALAIGQLLSALGRGDSATVDARYQEALGIATAEGWPAVRTGVELAYSQSLSQRGEPARALAHLERGFAAAQEATLAGDHQGPRLEAQALLSLAGAQATQGQLPQAAQSCAAAALRGQALGDALLTLESWRLASDFALRSGDAELAWALGAQATQGLPQLSVDQLHASTFPLLVEHLRALAPQRPWEEQQAVAALEALLRDTAPAREA